MWPLNMLALRHWILLLATVLFLASYLGLLTWGHIEQALERLAVEPANPAEYAMTRGEAFVIAFLFFMLSPIAVIAAFGLLAFVAAVLAGFLGSFVRSPDFPGWVLSSIAHAAILVGLYLVREWWLPPLGRVVGLVARAILIAAG